MKYKLFLLLGLRIMKSFGICLPPKGQKCGKTKKEMSSSDWGHDEVQ
jgi:hypothetical protein